MFAYDFVSSIKSVLIRSVNVHHVYSNLIMVLVWESFLVAKVHLILQQVAFDKSKSPKVHLGPR